MIYFFESVTVLQIKWYVESWNVTHRQVISLATTMTKAVFLFPTTTVGGRAEGGGARVSSGGGVITACDRHALGSQLPLGFGLLRGELHTRKC